VIEKMEGGEYQARPEVGHADGSEVQRFKPFVKKILQRTAKDDLLQDRVNHSREEKGERAYVGPSQIQAGRADEREPRPKEKGGCQRRPECVITPHLVHVDPPAQEVQPRQDYEQRQQRVEVGIRLQGTTATAATTSTTAAIVE